MPRVSPGRPTTRERKGVCCSNYSQEIFHTIAVKQKSWWSANISRRAAFLLNQKLQFEYGKRCSVLSIPEREIEVVVES